MFLQSAAEKACKPSRRANSPSLTVRKVILLAVSCSTTPISRSDLPAPTKCLRACASLVATSCTKLSAAVLIKYIRSLYLDFQRGAQCPAKCNASFLNSQLPHRLGVLCMCCAVTQKRISQGSLPTRRCCR